MEKEELIQRINDAAAFLSVDQLQSIAVQTEYLARKNRAIIYIVENDIEHHFAEQTSEFMVTKIPIATMNNPELEATFYDMPYDTPLLNFAKPIYEIIKTRYNGDAVSFVADAQNNNANPLTNLPIPNVIVYELYFITNEPHVNEFGLF